MGTALTLSRSHHRPAPSMGVCSGLRFYRHLLVGNALEASRTKQNRRRANDRFKVTVG
jgi:hypothetical protein